MLHNPFTKKIFKNKKNKFYKRSRIYGCYSHCDLPFLTPYSLVCVQQYFGEKFCYNIQCRIEDSHNTNKLYRMAHSRLSYFNTLVQNVSVGSAPTCIYRLQERWSLRTTFLTSTLQMEAPYFCETSVPPFSTTRCRKTPAVHSFFF